MFSRILVRGKWDFGIALAIGDLVGDENASAPKCSGDAGGREMDTGGLDVEGVVSVGDVVNQRGRLGFAK